MTENFSSGDRKALVGGDDRRLAAWSPQTEDAWRKGEAPGRHGVRGDRENPRTRARDTEREALPGARRACAGPVQEVARGRHRVARRLG